MIPHKYLLDSENLAQSVADEIGRQEVTLDWLYKNCTDDPHLWAWTSDEDYECGLDPWRYDPDPEMAAKRGWRLFIQRNSTEAELPPKMPKTYIERLAAFRATA
jgi:hypothetical protein